MKKKTIFLLGSILMATALVGGTFAAGTQWAISDNAAQFGVDITPGTIAIGETKSVTLEWGQKGLVDIEGLGIGDVKGPYAVGLKATTSDNTDFTGALQATISTTATGTTKLISHIKVEVYDNNEKSGTALMTLDGTHLDVSQDIEVNSGSVKNVYFYITLLESVREVFTTVKEQVVRLTVDWKKGSSVTEAQGRDIFFNNVSNWTNVYVYGWDADGNITGAWTDIKMTQVNDTSVYTAKLENAYTNIIFHNGGTGTGNQTENLTLAANETTNTYYNNGSWVDKANVDMTKVEYFVVGTHNSWTPGTAMTKLTPAHEGYTYSSQITVTAETEIKVVSSDNTWFAEDSTEGGAANVILHEAGTYTIYFNPNKVGSKYILCDKVSA